MVAKLVWWNSSNLFINGGIPVIIIQYMTCSTTMGNSTFTNRVYNFFGEYYHNAKYLLLNKDFFYESNNNSREEAKHSSLFNVTIFYSPQRIRFCNHRLITCLVQLVQRSKFGHFYFNAHCTFTNFILVGMVFRNDLFHFRKRREIS